MLENYSADAQRVVSLATMEARSLDHPRVGTEHLLLGLLADDDSVPAAVLRTVGANLVTARQKVIEAVGAHTGSVDGDALPFSARAQRALERAGRFSRKEAVSEVTAGHVLLGVLDVEGLASQVLRGLGVDIVHLRDAVAGSRDDVAVARDDEEPASVVPVAVASVAVVSPRCPHCRASLDDTLAEMLVPVRRAGEGAPTSELSVVYCTTCGATIGVVRPQSSPSNSFTAPSDISPHPRPSER